MKIQNMYSICIKCGTPREGLENRCKICGSPFKINIEFPFVKDNIKKNFPYIKEWVSLGEGNTPLIKINSIYFKLDYLNPTGSFKDRGSVTLISKLREMKISEICEDSSGNAGASIAAYASRAGIKAKIFVPESARGNKLKQIESYGAEVIKVRGNRSEVAKSAELCGVFYASHVLQPEFRDGIRSLAYELVRDLGWKEPDIIFIPISAGTLLLGVFEGFKHLLNSGLINKIPLIIGVQTTQVMPVCAKLKGLNYKSPSTITSIADALISTEPILIEEMVRVLKSYGDCIVVDDNEILKAHNYLARMGLLVEYSSATVMAAYSKYNIPKDYDTVLILTGNGLKTI
jgi:threonine synthase